MYSKVRRYGLWINAKVLRQEQLEHDMSRKRARLVYQSDTTTTATAAANKVVL